MSSESYASNGKGTYLLPVLALPDTLTENDYRKLEASYIPRELAVAAGIVRVDSYQGAELVGRQPKPSVNYAGLVFPHYWPGEVRLSEVRLRRDQPDLEQQPDGQVKEKGKYLSPPGRGNLLYFPPGTPADFLTDVAIPVAITEGEKKTLALSRFFSERGETRLIIGLPGVWNWRGTVGAVRDSRGHIAAMIKGVIPNFDKVAWKGRRVLIIFDANAATNESVAAARRGLAKELKRRGAVMQLVDLPEISGVNGVDDLLALKGPEFVANVLNKTEESKLTADGFEERDGSIYWLKQSGTESVRLTNFTATISGDVVRDDGAEQTRQFEITARLCDSPVWRTGTINAEEFESLRWTAKLLGARAVVYPGQKERASVAIRLLSNEVAERRVIAHTGWRNDDGQWRYYHAGGAIGAEGLIDAEVSLPPALEPGVLPEPPAGDELKAAFESVIVLLTVAPQRVTVPLFGAVFNCVLGGTDYSAHLFGYTGCGKTQLAALAQSFFGAKYDAQHLPASWSSTGNSLESLAHAAKDCVVVVDDFCPTGTANDQARMHVAADRILRAQGNHSGRARCRVDGSLRAAKPPRGLIISTGEDVPRGQSVRARLLVLEVQRGAINWSRLTQCQETASAGAYARMMSFFLQWLAQDGRIAKLQAKATTEIAKFRDAWMKNTSLTDSHKRAVTTLAQVAWAWSLWLQAAREAGALTADESKEQWDGIWKTLGEVGASQAAFQASENPATRFIELIRAALSSGKAHFEAVSGGEPDESAVWGWYEGQAQGDRIGWINKDGVYLQPDAAFGAAQRLASSGEGLTITSQTLWKRLKEAGFIRSTTDGERLKVKVTVGGSRQSVVHLGAEIFSQ